MLGECDAPDGWGSNTLTFHSREDTHTHSPLQFRFTCHHITGCVSHPASKLASVTHDLTRTHTCTRKAHIHFTLCKLCILNMHLLMQRMFVLSLVIFLFQLNCCWLWWSNIWKITFLSMLVKLFGFDWHLKEILVENQIYNGTACRWISFCISICVLK